MLQWICDATQNMPKIGLAQYFMLIQNKIPFLVCNSIVRYVSHLIVVQFLLIKSSLCNHREETFIGGGTDLQKVRVGLDRAGKFKLYL